MQNYEVQVDRHTDFSLGFCLLCGKPVCSGKHFEMSNQALPSSPSHIHYIDHNKDDEFAFPMSPPNIGDLPTRLTVRKNMFYTLFEDKETSGPTEESKVISPNQKRKVIGFTPSTSANTFDSALPYCTTSSQQSEGQISQAVQSQQLSAKSPVDLEAPHAYLDTITSTSMDKIIEKASKHQGFMRRSSSPSLIESHSQNPSADMDIVRTRSHSSRTESETATLNRKSLPAETRTVTTTEVKKTIATTTVEITPASVQRVGSSPSLVSKVSGLFRVPSASTIDTTDTGGVNKSSVSNQGGLLQDMNKKVCVKHKDLNIWGPTSM